MKSFLLLLLIPCLFACGKTQDASEVKRLQKETQRVSQENEALKRRMDALSQELEEQKKQNESAQIPPQTTEVPQNEVSLDTAPPTMTMEKMKREVAPLLAHKLEELASHGDTSGSAEF